MATAFDLDAYFKRIGYSGEQTPTLDTLSRLHFCHVETIPFENLNPLLGWPVPLDIGSLQRKLIGSGRGGYCYEQNLLFRRALETLGFDVTGLAARVVWNQPEGRVAPRTHMLLRVDLRGEVFIADVGFGGLTLTTPLKLEAGTEQTTTHEPFRVVVDAAEFVLQARLGETWNSLYRFTLQPQLMPDYEMANWYVARHPQSRFVHALIAARPMRGRRYALLNNELATHHLNGPSERRRLTTAAELRDVLAGTFGLTLPDGPQLDLLLDRLTRF